MTFRLNYRPISDKLGETLLFLDRFNNFSIVFERMCYNKAMKQVATISIQPSFLIQWRIENDGFFQTSWLFNGFALLTC